MSHPPLTIVLPLYAPQKDWHKVVWHHYHAIASGLAFEPSLIIVQDGGRHPLPEAIALLEDQIKSFRFLKSEPNRGKGATLRKGMAEVKTEFLIYTDIDFPYTTESFLRLWEELKNHDVVIGVKNESYYRQVPKFRVFISKLLKAAIGLLFKMAITDTQCGLKGMNEKGKALYLATEINRYLCDLEFVYLCFKERPKLKIASVKLGLRPGIKFSQMNFKILVNESFNFLKIVFRKPGKNKP